MEGGTMLRIVIVMLASIALTVLFAAPAFPLSLLLNGGFERPFLDSWAWPYGPGSTDITGWRILAGTVDIVVQDYWQPYLGRQSLDLDGISAGSLEQEFRTTPGETYWLSFAYANNCYGWAPSTANVNVLGSGGSGLLSRGISHFGSSQRDMRYTIFMESFVADDVTSRLRFTSTDDLIRHGIALDAVGVYATPTLPWEEEVPPVPEATTLRLFGLGLAGVIGLLCLRRLS
jgi:hypothetical protein